MVARRGSRPVRRARGCRKSDGHGGVVGLAGAVGLIRSCAVVLPVVHGPRGEDGTLAALCELAGVAYVGSGVRAGALAMDKWATKLVAEAVGVRTAAGLVATRADTLAFTGPVVVKPVSSGSSHGVTRVDRAEHLAGALELALSLDDRALVEEVVHGREIDLAVLRAPDDTLLVAPALEVVGEGVFDTETKYDGSAVFRLPADLDDVQRKELEAAAVTMYEALGCRGVARIDFFLTASGPVLNEVNTMPGMTEQSQVPKMFAAAGLPYPELLDLMVCAAR
ncbi:D-alanine--D-alanine ligase [metagenome]|uniref:D-alanine--D-alanine ligase n=1 Tax=metagenome TaxID=256318 RepID=A0A2P2C4Z5_9ZZZZ